MRSSWKTLIAAAAVLVVVPQLAAADEVQEQLTKMQERMAQLEDSLKATQDELNSAQSQVAEQQQVISRSGLDEERSGLSALSAFLNETEFGGVAAASYNYNFEDPAGGANVGTTPISAHNSFQLDQLHFSMANEATEKSRAGFGVDMIYGSTSTGPGGGDGPTIVQAYASYLMPVLGGMELTAGRYDTKIGAEVVYVGQNTNITRGILWNLQPISHTGARLEMPIGENFNAHFGVQNSAFVAYGPPGTNEADNNAKTYTVGGGWSSDKAGINATYMAFDDVANTGPTDRGHYLDLVASWDPSDNLAVWANFDWIRNGIPGGANGDNVYALALATRLGITDKTGVGVRGEFVGARPVAGADVDAYSLTTTVDHALTDSLTGRVEFRWDRNDDLMPFVSSAGGAKGDQFLIIGQMIYAF